MAVGGKRFLESNASSNPGTYFRLGYVKVPRIEEDSIRGTFDRQLPLIRNRFLDSRKHSFRGTFYRQLPWTQDFSLKIL